MTELSQYLEKILMHNPFKLVLSSPHEKNIPNKITILEKSEFFQKEWLENNQAFHKNIIKEQLPQELFNLLSEHYQQLCAFDGTKEYRLKITKKGKILFSNSTNLQEVPSSSHNREKSYLLEEGNMILPLIDMGIFTKKGVIVSSMHDKYKQINRFLELIDDSLSTWKKETITVVDFGCGKSYLTFLLYHYLTEIKHLNATVIGLDLKKDVIANCQKTAEKYQYTGLHFELGDVSGWSPKTPIDMVVSLHACDTATDYALFNGIKWEAELIFSVPCCQKELNKQISSKNLSILTRYGIIKERFSAQLTDIMRANLLITCGYRAQILEFVDFENTPKNTLIRAIKSPLSAETKEKAQKEIEAVKEEFSVTQTLDKLLSQK